MNHNTVIMVMGLPNSGKSHSLSYLKNPERWVLLNSDLKALPIKIDFAAQVRVEDPLHIFQFIQEIEENPDIDGIVIDTLTYLIDRYETMHVLTATNTQQAWGSYSQYFKKLITRINASPKDFIVMAHAHTDIVEATGQINTYVPVKGALKKTGVEGEFNTILGAEVKKVTDLEQYESDYLTVTPEEDEDGVKRVFITRTTKATLGSKMRSPPIWSRNDLYIDNNIQTVIDKHKEYENS